MRCTVIIPTYNRAVLLDHTLAALTRQTLPVEDFEVIVVDDGSTDSTAEVTATYESQLSLRYLAQADEGYRVARARNLGISEAEGEICVFLDCGVIAHSGCLQSHVDAHASHSEPIALCGYVYGLSFDDSEADRLRQAADPRHPDDAVAALASEPGTWGDPRDPFFHKYSDDFSYLPAPWVVYWTCNASARTNHLREVGMFDEFYRSWGAEDIDLGYRLHRGGARFLLARDAVAVHWPHAKDRSANTASVMANYRHLIASYDDPAIRLLGRVRLLDLNDELMSQR